ncbi:MAG TPA: class I adenylate-forming enzyme family protein, partial [Pirellulaceae bacterium]
GRIPPRTRQNKPEDLGRWFADIARRNAARPLIRVGGQSLAYGWFLEQASQLAHSLRREASFTPGALVALLHENSPEYVIGFYGILLAGGTVVPIHPQVDADRIGSILDVSHPTHLLEPLDRSRTWGMGPEITVRGESRLVLTRFHSKTGTSASSDSRARRKRTDVAAVRPAVVLFTSGSTGTPKGVMLSHRNLISNALAIRRMLRIRQADCGLANLPFHFAFGNSVLQSHALAGASLVLEKSLVCAESYPRAVRQHAVTGWYGVPDQIRFLAHHGWLGRECCPDLRHVAVAGGALESSEARALSEHIRPAQLILMYGQTEATARLSYLPPQELPRRPDSIGRGIPGVTLQVVRPDGSPVRPGETGELRARGPNVMLGYWRDPAATRRVLRSGWLWTGDLATTDAEGWIYLRGRKNQWVKIAGHRVHPSEI